MVTTFIHVDDKIPKATKAGGLLARCICHGLRLRDSVPLPAVVIGFQNERLPGERQRAKGGLESPDSGGRVICTPANIMLKAAGP